MTYINTILREEKRREEKRREEKRREGITAPFFRIRQHIFEMDNRLT